MNFQVMYEENDDHPGLVIYHTDEDSVEDYDVFATFDEARTALTEHIEQEISDLQHIITYLELITEEEVS